MDVTEVNYVFAFLLGIRLTSSIFYRARNLLPFVAGSNLLGVYRWAVPVREREMPRNSSRLQEVKKPWDRIQLGDLLHIDRYAEALFDSHAYPQVRQ
jgi:hypothetical protein